MSDPIRELRDALRSAAIDFGGDASISESELVNRWFTYGIFDALGFGTTKNDYRVELRIPGAGRADVVLRSFGQRAHSLIEFKRPLTTLREYTRQLRDYARELLPVNALLTNGSELWFYSRRGPQPLDPLVTSPRRFDLAHLTISEARFLWHNLHKAELDLADPKALSELLSTLQTQQIRVEGPASPGGNAFLELFRLDEMSVFGRLVREMFNSLPQLVARSTFASGAYSFWVRAYARDLTLDEAPRAWRPFLPHNPSANDLRQFMFALESSYAIIARALLVKAMQDVGFPDLNALDTFRRAVRNREAHGRIELTEYLGATQELFSHAGRQAFPALFASDIFDWWEDAKLLPQSGPVAGALAEVILAVLGFSFDRLKGDVLGDLYQAYFDPETRLALGEFYTPPEVVEFILDQVGYSGPDITHKRLIDPACGSGTFIVAALRRYLKAQGNRPARHVLDSLLRGLLIVGLDVNPFATLLAQINYATQILPLYARVAQQGHIVISTVPIFRTDSLRYETRESEEEAFPVPPQRARPIPDRQPRFPLTYQTETSLIRERIPVRVQSEYLRVELKVPRADLALEKGYIDNLEEYAFALSALFDTVDSGEGHDELIQRLRATGVAKPSDLAQFMSDALQSIRATVENLRTKYDDGRFRKTLRDLAVALVVKNQLKYDFVIGNPPYVRVQNLPSELKEYWEDKYQWVDGNFDLYMPFIERALTDWLKEEGKLGFICSNRFLVTNYAERLRTAVPAVAAVDLIVDLRDAQIFKGATNYPAIFVMTRGKIRERFIAARAYSRIQATSDTLIGDIASNIGKLGESSGHVRSDLSDAFSMRSSDLAPQGWHLMPADERRVFDRLKNAANHQLSELTATSSGSFQGWATGSDDACVLRLVEDRGDTLVLEPRGGGGPFELEREAVRPWLFGHDVRRWQVNWGGWYVIFPYRRYGSNYELIPSREFAERFPYAQEGEFIEQTLPLLWNYLTTGYIERRRATVHQLLQSRESGRYRGALRHRWYAASAPRSIEYYGAHKLVFQVSSTAPDVAVDEARFFFAGGGTSGVNGIALKTEYAEIRPFLCAILNSRTLDYVLKHVSDVFSGGSYSYGDQFIKQLPVRLPDSGGRSLAASIVSTGQRLTDLTQQRRALQDAVHGFPRHHLASTHSSEVFPLDQLTEHGNLPLSFARDGNLLEHQLDGRPLVHLGRGLIVFPSQEHGEVTLKWLERQRSSRVARADLFELRLPVAPKDCRSLLSQLEDTELSLGRLDARIHAEEAGLDEAVLSYYGVNSSDRRVIDRFLTRF
ncbi:MAG: N-6 DNA methylase [Dehalococcoidia bacterium]